jgi:tRNA(Ile)-lysidine synthase
MPVSRALGRGKLLRPLLDLPRVTLEAYAHEQCITWVEDPSNRDERFDRNYLRREVLPRLTARWPGAPATIARAARLLREDAQARAALAPEIHYSAAGDPGIALEALTGEPPLAAMVLRAFLLRCGLERPPERRLREFLRQCAGAGGASLSMPDWTLQRFRDGIYVFPRLARPEPPRGGVAVGECRRIDGSGTVWVENVVGGESSESRPALHEGTEPPALVLRFRRGGERLQLCQGHHRDLKHLFQEWGLPPWWRDRVPLLFENREGAHELLAVGGEVIGLRGHELGLRLRWEPSILVPSLPASD